MEGYSNLGYVVYYIFTQIKQFTKTNENVIPTRAHSIVKVNELYLTSRIRMYDSDEIIMSYTLQLVII